MRIATLSIILVSLSFTAANASTESGHPISPRILQDMVGTIASNDASVKSQPLTDRTIPFPAAIAYDKQGCFAGYFPNSDIQNIRFDCIKGLERFSLEVVHPEASRKRMGEMVVLELIPSFANDKCKPCGTMGEDLRSALKAKSIKAQIIRVDIGYR